MRANGRALLILLTLIFPITAQAGEDVRDIELYQKTQGDKSWRDYQRWKHEGERTRIYDRMSRRQPKGHCRAGFEAEGKKMLGNFLAKREARLQWERVVRARYGEEFGDIEYASGVDFDCWSVGAFRRCRLTAAPCRAG